MNPIARKLMTGCFVALISVIMLDASDAQQPAAPKAKAVPKLDAEALRIPDSIHDTSAKKIDRSHKVLPPPNLPNKVDLGKYDLEFRAKHSSDVNPRTGYDSGEKSNLSNSSVGRKSDPALPNYFGLKLSTPTD
jgi:hypothetical protein